MMASTSKSTRLDDTLRDITECTLCLDTLKNPKAFPCLHTFCLECIRKYGNTASVREREIMECPNCRKGFRFVKDGADRLPDNFVLKKLIESGNVSKKRKFDVSCELCDDSEEAATFCFECDLNICEPCSKRHKKARVTMNHQFSPLNMGAKIDAKYIYCSQHKDRLIERYCYSCEVTICLLCCVDSHNGHKSSDMEQAAKYFRELLIVESCKVVNSILPLEKEMVILENIERDFVDEITEKKRLVLGYGEVLKGLIDAELKEIYSQFDEDKLEATLKFVERKAAVQVLIDNAKKHEKKAQNLINRQDTRVVAWCGNVILRRLHGALEANNVDLEQERPKKDFVVRFIPTFKNQMKRITTAFFKKVVALNTDGVDDSDGTADDNQASEGEVDHNSNPWLEHESDDNSNPVSELASDDNSNPASELKANDSSNPASESDDIRESYSTRSSQDSDSPLLPRTHTSHPRLLVTPSSVALTAPTPRPQATPYSATLNTLRLQATPYLPPFATPCRQATPYSATLATPRLQATPYSTTLTTPRLQATPYSTTLTTPRLQAIPYSGTLTTMGAHSIGQGGLRDPPLKSYTQL